MPVTIIKRTPRDRLASILKQRRTSAGLTQNEVAASLKRPQSYVSKVESGKRKLEVTEFIGFCYAVKANPALVLYDLIGRRGIKKVT